MNNEQYSRLATLILIRSQHETFTKLMDIMSNALLLIVKNIAGDTIPSDIARTALKAVSDELEKAISEAEVVAALKSLGGSIEELERELCKPCVTVIHPECDTPQ